MAKTEFYESESRSTKSMTLKQYVKMKIRLFERDFHIKLSESEIEHMKSLKNEIQVDNYARDILFRK